MSKEREVLKLARDVLLPYKSTGLRWYTDVDEALDAIEEVLAQPEEQRSCDKQEPVGINGLTEAETNATASVMGLVNTPPQREWVGLTDEEIDNAVWHLGFGQLSPREVARAIEAKLKEKNT